MRRFAALACCAFVFVALAGPAARASRLEDKAVEIGPGITPPDVSGALVLETPEGVAETEAHATLTIRLLLDKSGQVRRAEALDPPDPRLAAAAVERLEKMSFSPARRDKKPVVAWWNKKITFRPRTELDAEIPSIDCIPAAHSDPIRDNELTDDVELPRLIEKVEPVYPRSLIANRVEGQARFACVIDTCGRVRDCRVVDASHGAFARAGLDAVVRRRYAPARRDGKPDAITFTIGVTFKVW